MFYLGLFLLMVSVVMGSIYFRKIQPRLYSSFLYYLILNFVAEAAAITLLKNGYHNFWIYDTLLSIQVVYFLWLFYKNFRANIYRKVILIMLCITLPFIAINFIFLQGLNTFHTNTFSLGTLFLVIAIIFFYKDILIKVPNFNPFRDFLFWAATGILLNYLLSFPYLSVFNYIFNQNKALSVQLQLLSTISSCLAFSCYIIGYLCHKNQEI